MFILKTLFWLGVVILLLPTGKTDGGNPEALSQAPAFSTGDAIGAAYSTVNDLSSFCSRNPQPCAVGAAAFALVEAKAKNGVRIVYRWATGEPRIQAPVGPDQPAGQDAALHLSGSLAADMGVTGSIMVAGASDSRNTLRIEDVLPDWGGPEAGKRA